MLGAVREDFQAIVIGAQLRFVSSLVLLALWKLRRRPVILWGQGFDKDEDVGGIGRAALAVKRRLKRTMARSADGYLVYTAGGRERLVNAGLDPERVFVVRNTLDVEEQITIHDGFKRRTSPSSAPSSGCARTRWCWSSWGGSIARSASQTCWRLCG